MDEDESRVPASRAAGDAPTPEPAPAGDLLGELGPPEFAVVESGYDRAEVDAYIRRARDLLDGLSARRSVRAEVQRALDEVGRDASAVLQRAHEVAEEVKERGRLDADETRRTAQAEAEAMVARARERVLELERELEVLQFRRSRTLEDVRRVASDLERAAEEVDRVADRAEERLVEPTVPARGMTPEEEWEEPVADEEAGPGQSFDSRADVLTPAPFGRTAPVRSRRMRSVPPPGAEGGNHVAAAPLREAEGPDAGRSVGHRLRDVWRHAKGDEGEDG